MSLKTATLLAMIGIGVHFFMSIVGTLAGPCLYQIHPLVGQCYWVFTTAIFTGSILLFLIVFYSKQKE